MTRLNLCCSDSPDFIETMPHLRMNKVEFQLTEQTKRALKNLKRQLSFNKDTILIQNAIVRRKSRLIKTRFSNLKQSGYFHVFQAP